MPTFSDDNFGTYEIFDDDDVEWYNRVQEASILKICIGCHQEVYILPQYAYCDYCATRLEHGCDIIVC